MKKRNTIALLLTAATLFASCGKVPTETAGETTVETVKETTRSTAATTVEETEEEIVATTAAEAVTDLSEFSSLTEGSLFVFGEYEGEPIEWIVLNIDPEKEEIYCITKDIVSSQPYEEDGSVILWNDSSLCYWLNRDFFEAAFSDEEKVRIETSVNTAHRLFLMDRIDYSLYADILEMYPVDQYWWLRSRNDGSTGVADCVNNSGELCFDCIACVASSGVRPAMKIYFGDDEDRLDPEALIPVPEPTPIPTPSPTPVPEPVERSYYDGLVVTEYTELGNDYHFPHINIDTDEINALNQKIKDDVYVESDGTVRDRVAYTAVYFGICSYYDGIYSLVVDYSYEGWGGCYRAYTFNSEGHVLTSSEVLALVGLNEDNFYDAAADATQICINDRYTENGIPPVIDHAVNPEWVNNTVFGPGTDALIADNFSIDTINTDMPMLIDDQGRLCICQMILPFADAHDTECFIAIPDGERGDYNIVRDW